MNTLSHGLMFHHFHDDRHPIGQGAISADEFRSILEFVGVDNILPAREWLHRAEKGTLRPRDLCLTFDDNLLCQKDVALPVMKSLGLSACWFVYSSVLHGNLERMEIYRYFRTVQFKDVDAFYEAFFQTAEGSSYGGKIREALQSFKPETYLTETPFYTDQDKRFRFVRDRVLGDQAYKQMMDLMIEQNRFDMKAAAAKLWMNGSQLKQLHSEGHVIGLHGYSHPMQMGELPVARQQEEYHHNLEDLQTLLGTAPTAMSHPCNSYNQDTLAILSKLGIKVGFRANMADVPHRSALEWPREDHANLLKAMQTKTAS